MPINELAHYAVLMTAQPMSLRRSALFAFGFCVAAIGVACGDDASGDASTTDGGIDSGLGDSGLRDSGLGGDAESGSQLTMTGSAGGLTLANVNGFGVIAKSDSPRSKTRFRMIFEDRANLCSAGVRRQNATLLNIDLESPEETLKPGTFPIFNIDNTRPPYADAPFVKLNETCKPTPNRGAKSGNVVLTSVTDSSVSGTFDITYADGRIEGSFTVPLSCPAFPDLPCAP